MLYSKMYVPFRIDLELIVYLLNVRRSPIDLITNGNNNKSTMMMEKTFKWKLYGFWNNVKDIEFQKWW